MTSLISHRHSRPKIFIDPDEVWRRQVYYDEDIDIIPTQEWIDGYEENDETNKSDKSEDNLDETLVSNDSGYDDEEKLKFLDKSEEEKLAKKVVEQKCMKTSTSNQETCSDLVEVDKNESSNIKKKSGKFYEVVMNCFVQLLVGRIADGRSSHSLDLDRQNTVEENVEVAIDPLQLLAQNEPLKRYGPGGQSSRVNMSVWRNDANFKVANNQIAKTKILQCEKYSRGIDFPNGGKVRALSALFDTDRGKIRNKDSRVINRPTG